MTSRLSRSAFILKTLVIAALLTGCSPDDQSAGRPPRPTPEVKVVTIMPQRAVLTAQLPGRTVPYAVSDVRPQVNGILKARLFAEGSLVTAGQALYQIDDTLYQSANASALAQLENARAALTMATLKAQRYTSLRRDKSISQQDYDDAKAELQQGRANVAQQQANVASARINLGYTSINAPISGRIGRSYLTQGALVKANQDQALATIQTLDPIYVDMNQSSGEMFALRKSIAAGQMSDQVSAVVTLILQDGSAYAAEGTLQFREVVVDQTTGTVTLRAQFPNPDGVLLPGMFVRATIIEGVEPNALLVPQRGVGRDDKGNATALIVGKDGVVAQRMLEVSQIIGTNWLVHGGINAGDRVIVEGLQYVRPGQKANAVSFQPATTSGGDAQRALQAKQ